MSSPETSNRESTQPTGPSPDISTGAPLGLAIPERASWSTVHPILKPVSSVFIIGLLIGLAIWGHSTGWTFPKFSALVRGNSHETANPIEGDDAGWCAEHNVPESACIECNASLAPPGPDYGWCAEHGIAACPLHHPDVAQLDNARPPTASELNRVARALALLPRAENNSRCKNYQRRIQFASIESIDKAGIDIALVREAPITEAIVAPGEIIYDQDHLAHLAQRVGGTVCQVERQVGDRTRRGDILAVIDSADVGRAKSDLIQSIFDLRIAQATVARLQPLASDGAVPGKQLREAEARQQETEIKLLAAQQTLVNLGLPVSVDGFNDLGPRQIADRLQFLGLPDDLVARLGDRGVSANLLPLRSPLDGIIVDRHVVSGEVIDPGKTVFTVANLASMWLMLNVRQEDAGQLAMGQAVVFRSNEGNDGPSIQGTIAWISTEADEKTRTVKVRASLANADGLLRANTFGVGRVILREEPKALVVPSEAVHTDGDCSIVFVRDKSFLRDGAPKFFHVREVRLGVRDGDTTEIIAGLVPGEVIASKNSLILEAQLLKSNLGEGCACCAGKKENKLTK